MKNDEIIVPLWNVKFVIPKDSELKIRGPFYYSNKWVLVSEQAKQIFGDDEGDSWRSTLKEKAFNKSYEPPENHIHLARSVIIHLESENRKLREKLIESNKELSKLKRKQNHDKRRISENS